MQPAQTSADKAHGLHKVLEAFRSRDKKDEWTLAELLYKLRRYELWRFAVGGFDSWEDYLKQPEIGISRHKADKMVRIYEYFIIERGFQLPDLEDVPWYALDFISKKRPEADLIAQLLADAKVLTQKDFKEAYYDHTEVGPRTYSYVLMRKCDQTGNLEKVHELDSETIKTKLGL